MKLIFDMLELAIDIFEVFLVFHYLLKFEVKPNKYFILPTIIAEVGIIFLNLFNLKDIIRSLYMIFVPTIINIFSEKERKNSHSFYVLFSTLLIGTTQSLILNTIRIGSKILYKDLSKIFLGYFVLLITLFLWYIITTQITKNYYGLSYHRHTCFFIFVSLTALFNSSVYSVFIYCVKNFGLKLYKHARLVEWFLFFFGLALIAEIIYIIYLYYEKTHYSVVSSFAQKYLDIEKEHFEEYQQKVDDTRHFRHDIENHLSIMNHHAQVGEITLLTNYLQKLSATFSNLTFKYRTANETINGILNKADHTLKENNINLSIEGKLDEFKVINDFDLCTIVSNALYNSIEACMKVPETLERWIKIRFRTQGIMYFICFTNPIAEDISLVEGRPMSTKADQKNHGFGLIQIEHIVSLYKGDLQFNCENNIFELTVLLKKETEGNTIDRNL